MSRMNMRWVGADLDNEANRRKFIRFLKGWHNEMTTPYWDTPFVNWLIYECTIHPCGLRVESITEDFVTLCAHCAGVQTEGICLDATFKVPTRMFKTPDLVKMIGPYRYHKNGPAMRFEWFPGMNDKRVGPEHIAELAWWYDESYDETGDGDE